MNQPWILDTDTVSLIQRGRETLRRRLLTTPPEQIAVTVITLFEQLRGRLADVNRAREGSLQLFQAYRRLAVHEVTAERSEQETVAYYCSLMVLPFDDAAATQLTELRKQKVRLSTQDLRIAAIALSVDGILVTCNTRDFRKIPGLSIEDWSQT